MLAGVMTRGCKGKSDAENMEMFDRLAPELKERALSLYHLSRRVMIFLKSGPQAIRGEAGWDAPPTDFKLGDRVSKLFELAEGRFEYGGVISAVGESGSVTVAFDDGETQVCSVSDLSLLEPALRIPELSRAASDEHVRQVLAEEFDPALAEEFDPAVMESMASMMPFDDDDEL